ncbi:uncharacterized protein LOC130362401 [Hyla sarda]|uniref:uncharacterized protein LOC130362401 n=1 Tax=Hyla sarda TaxID=327740 RepID=UPI0024C2171D|nr:uncharacterized protein LOC130362401 [Hyla sarda]XP_056422769.1 uncharacterized protein LOC130362401 [Hyla sarda]XP_056422770.1 uncharacterized protein LOC130362401 [Hyla sarda]XP_056422771.1 uncharacterized protein LOC130362401 [Hyla sarda]XP_056422772.1 uncharacterized protein LOC130362401 [Hyla sarda]
METDGESSTPEVGTALSVGRTDAGAYFTACECNDTLQMLSLRALEHKVMSFSEKEVRLFWTVNSLRSYDECNRAPRGLRMYKEPSQFLEDDNFLDEWKQAHLEHSLRLMRIVLKRNEVEYNLVAQELCRARLELRSRHSEEQFTAFMKKLEKKLLTTQAETKDRKRDKFLRDKMDFETGRIHDWGNRKQQSRRRSRPRNKNNDQWTTDSDSSRSDDPASGNASTRPAGVPKKRGTNRRRTRRGRGRGSKPQAEEPEKEASLLAITDMVRRESRDAGLLWIRRKFERTS